MGVANEIRVCTIIQLCIVSNMAINGIENRKLSFLIYANVIFTALKVFLGLAR